MLPLILTDRHGETYAIFHTDQPIPLGYYPAHIDRSFNRAMRFVMSLHRAERHKLETYAKLHTHYACELLIEQLERRRLLVYRKDTSKQDKLAVEVLRNAIREVLDNILAEERKEAEAIAREHEQRNPLEKAAAYHQAFNQGAAEGAFSLLKFLKELRDVVDPMRLFTRSGKSAWDAAEGGLEGFADKFTRNLSAAHYREIVEALGFDPARIDRKTLYLALDIAQTVWEDADTQAILTRFARELAAAQHGLEWAKLAGGTAFELMLTAILAALTAGTGVAVSLGTKAARLKKLGELLHDMVAPLKRFRRRWTYGGKGKPGRQTPYAAPVEEVNVPAYQAPPRRTVHGEGTGPRAAHDLSADPAPRPTSTVLRSGEEPGTYAYSKSPDLGRQASIAELLETGYLPGDYRTGGGVVLTDQAVRFGDIYKLSTLNGRRVEFSLTREVIDGKRVKVLYSGAENNVQVPLNARIIGHSHPTPHLNQKSPSHGDKDALNYLYLRQLRVNRKAKPQPSRIFWGPGDSDNTLFYPDLKDFYGGM